MLTLNNGTTVKVCDFLLISQSFIYNKQVSESTDAENPITNIATQMSTPEGRIIMQLDRNGQKQIKFSGLSITPDVLLSNIFDDLFSDFSDSIPTAPSPSNVTASINEPKNVDLSEPKDKQETTDIPASTDETPKSYLPATTNEPSTSHIPAFSDIFDDLFGDSSGKSLMTINFCLIFEHEEIFWAFSIFKVRVLLF